MSFDTSLPVAASHTTLKMSQEKRCISVIFFYKILKTVVFSCINSNNLAKFLGAKIRKLLV
jgi:hypothetical protein